MTQQMKNPNAQPVPDDWIDEDLANSGLTREMFAVQPLQREAELQDRLGFTTIQDKDGNWIKIIDIGGYWIPYPNVPGYYRLKLKEKIGDAKYLSPKDRGNHAYILPQVKEIAITYSPDKPLFLTEGEKKCCKATLEGFPCIGLSGAWNFKDSESDFLAELDHFVWKDRIVYVGFDSDIAEKHNVKHAEIRLAVELINRRARVYSIRVPNEDDGGKNGLDDYLVKYGAEKFRVLIQNAKPTLELQVEGGTETNLFLRELPWLENEIQRAKVLKLIAGREGVSVADVRTEYQKQIPKKEETEETKQEKFTPEEMEKALELLKSPDILKKMRHLTSRRGYVGEEINKTILYLSFISRLLISSISTIIKGASASGKSALANSVLTLFPKGAVLSFSFLTSKALVHFNGDLSHKILFVQEHSGSQASEYSIRTTLSENEISIALPIKDELTGNFTTVEKRVPAVGLVFVETTTKERVHNENQTRVFDLYMDESEEQTEKVLKAEAEQDDQLSPDLEAEATIWKAAQTLLECHSVYIPFSKKLIEAFPKGRVRVRRDFKRFLSLIKTHCLLYQFQREKDARGQLIATIEDLKAILPIAEVILVQSHKEISPKLEEVLTTIEKNFGVNKEFAFGEVEEKSDIKDRTLRRYLRELVKNDLISHNGKTGKESRYMLLSNLSSLSSMTNFSSKALKILEKIEDNAECPQMSSMSSKDGNEIGFEDNKDNKGKRDVSSKSFNSEEQLDEKPLFEDKRKEDIEKGDMPNYLQGVEP